jgi:hypothetical protein
MKQFVFNKDVTDLIGIGHTNFGSESADVACDWDKGQK